MVIKVGILQTGDQGEAIAAKYRSNADLFKTLLDGFGFEFEVFEVNHGKLPESAKVADSYIITGSQHGVYEDHYWIASLERFVRDCFKKDIPIVGICFGHQLMAQALGGKVEKFEGGWALGRQEYRNEKNDLVEMNAFHQDQVMVPPKVSKTILTSDFCKYAAFSYGKKGLSFQGHPEMDAVFINDLLDAKADLLSQKQSQEARSSLDYAMDVTDITSDMVRMLTSGMHQKI